MFGLNSQVLGLDGQVPLPTVQFSEPYWQTRRRTLQVFANDPAGTGDSDSDNDDEQSDDDADDFDKDRAKALIRKLREKEKADKVTLKAARDALAAAEAKDKAQQDKDKSELEKAQARLAEMEKAHSEATEKLKRTLIAQAVERAALKANARNPEVVAKLINQSELELDDSGAPTNADELVKALLKAEPYLVATEPAAERGAERGVPATPRSAGQPGHEARQKVAADKLATSGNYAEL